MAQNNPDLSFDQMLQEVLGGPEPDQVQLQRIRSRVMSHWEAAPRPSWNLMMHPVLRWGLAMLLAAAVIIAAAGPRNVQAAFRRLLGYIPGIGLVEREQGTRILAAPVILERDGLTAAVIQGVLNSDRTSLYLEVSGSSLEHLQDCLTESTLNLPGGKSLPVLGIQGGGITGKSQLEIGFDPLPKEVDHASLVLPCLGTPDREQGQSAWIFNLEFLPAGPTFTEHPVTVLPTPTSRPTPTQVMTLESPPAVGSEEDQQQNQGGKTISLSVDQLVQLDEGFIIYASLRWNPSQFDFIFPRTTILRSAEGYQLPFTMISPDLHPNIEIAAPGQHLLAYQVDTGNYSLPVSLEIDGAIATIPLDYKIHFDVGENPFAGPWEINSELKAAGHQVRIIEVDAVTINGQPGFEVLFETDGEVTMPSLVDHDHQVISAGGGPRGENRFSAFILYDKGWPSGEIRLQLESLKVPIDGRWEASW